MIAIAAIAAEEPSELLTFQSTARRIVLGVEIQHQLAASVLGQLERVAAGRGQGEVLDRFANHAWLVQGVLAVLCDATIEHVFHDSRK